MFDNLDLMINRNRKMIKFCDNQFMKNRVNLQYCTDANLGDLLSPIVCKYLLSKRNLSFEKNITKTKHLYAIGSILTMGKQDAVIWGSGAINDESLWTLIADRKKYRRRLDIRAVRGKYTKELLEQAGYEVGDVLGDPAILLPIIYDPRNLGVPLIKKYKVTVIVHFDKVPLEWKEKYPEINFLSVKTDDYKRVIDVILASEKVISSSLHGIILSESYGVPAVMIMNDVWNQIFKYYDWFSASGREDFAIASSLNSALEMPGSKIPNLEQLRTDLIKSFPYDLFE